MPLKLLKGIRHFKNNAFLENENLFSALTGGQNPDILFITCSDSRIIPSSITHAKYGDLFVIRNAGNIVPPYSPEPSGEAATIEYALKVLDVKEIILCGHSQCGAMCGLLAPQPEKKLPAIASWLSYAEPALSRVKEKYPELEENSPAKLVHTTQENILIQIENLKTHPSVKEKLESKQLLLHAWFYDIKSGEIFIYHQDCDAFISFEEAVTEVFSSTLVQNTMRTIVEEEAMNYLTRLASPKTAESYKELKKQLEQLASKGVSAIWEPIQKGIRLRLWSEFGDLCEDLKGSVDERFIELLEKAQEVKLTNLKSLHRTITKSTGYQQFCSQTMRNTIDKAETSLVKQEPQDAPQFFMQSKL